MNRGKFIWISIPVFIVTWDSLCFFLFLLPVIILALAEFYAAMEEKKYFPQKIMGLAAGIFVYLAVYVSEKGLDSNFTGLAVAVFLFLFFIISLVRKDFRNIIPSVSVTLLGVMYIPYLLAHAVLLRDMRPCGKGFIYLLALTTAAINGAGYYVDTKFAGSRMKRFLNQNKSYPGLIAGLLAAILAVFLWARVSGMAVLKNYDLSVRFLSGMECFAIGFLIWLTSQAGEFIGPMVISENKARMLRNISNFLFSSPLLYYYFKLFVLK